MKTVLVILLAVLAVASAGVIPEWESVPIHYVKQWRDAFPKLAELMPIDEDIPTSRIAGGEEAQVGQFPYQALVNAAFAAGSAFCGGSLISTSWVLTAAHCTDPDAGIIEVTTWLGAHHRINFDAGEQRMSVNENILHADWTPSLIRNDIAVLHINPIILSATINIISLAPTDSPTFAGVTAFASGWGRIGDAATEGPASVLRFVDLPVISNAECAASFGIVVESTICTSGANGRNICSGDSGGPLTFNGAQIGIVNFGSAAGCTNGLPAGYARIPYFRAWINQMTGI